MPRGSHTVLLLKFLHARKYSRIPGVVDADVRIEVCNIAVGVDEVELGSAIIESSSRAVYTHRASCGALVLVEAHGLAAIARDPAWSGLVIVSGVVVRGSRSPDSAQRSARQDPRRSEWS